MCLRIMPVLQYWNDSVCVCVDGRKEGRKGGNSYAHVFDTIA